MNASPCSSLLAFCLGWPFFLMPAHQETGEVPRSTQVGELFQANCASCHGVLGDGEGVTDLDRKARSFRDGGFSYGNTPKTVQRTITTGIPGTPMPAFGGALNDKQIADLAMYVIELGPGLPPPPKNTEMIVKDRPLVVRGMLPPIAEGALTHPRGLLIGMPDGFTFEYRVDDVRLLGMRQGRFVDRTDWVGRGGTGLQPLGKVVGLVEGGNPDATFGHLTESGSAPLRADLTLTQVQHIESFDSYLAQIAYHLVSESEEHLAEVVESVNPFQLEVGSGYRRQWILNSLVNEIRLELRGFASSELSPVTGLGSRTEIKKRALPNGDLEYTALTRTIAEKKNWPKRQEGVTDIRVHPDDLTILQSWVIVVPAESLVDFDEADVIDELTEVIR